MSKNNYRPNYQAIYPGIEISQAVLDVLHKSDRKMKYIEQDLKIDHPIKRKPDENPRSKPAREDSYERLLELNHEFDGGEATPEHQLMLNMELGKLRSCLFKLDENEKRLIHYLFHECQTEQEVAEYIGITQQAVNKRKAKLIDKIRHMMKSHEKTE